MDGPVLVRDDPGGGVAVLTLSRPAQLNALSDALLAALGSTALHRMAAENHFRR